MREGVQGLRLRGNLLDHAVAVVLATAFGAVLAAFTDAILMAFIAAIVGKPRALNLSLHLQPLAG